MATKLEKDVIRESNIKYDDREIIVTLGADQRVTMKLKGMKSGTVSIDIQELYNQLVGGDVDESVEDKPKAVRTKQKNGDVKIDLHMLRAHSAIADFDYETTAKFDQLIKKMIDEQNQE